MDTELRDQHRRVSPCCEDEARRYLVSSGADKRLDATAVRDYLTSPATEKALAEALVPDSTPEWRATEAKRLLAALVADADRRGVE